MKIFWSWQSDLDGKISRHFIKDCLKIAVEELKDEAIFDDRVEIDHDTKDVPGSPPITDTILDKIKNCSVFVADVTPVAEVKTSGKKIMNPNVAIETGYAIALVGNKNILSILNESFGNLDDLPFDLRYKRGPVTYDLSEDVSKDIIDSQKKALVDKLKIALKNYTQIHEGVVVSRSVEFDVNGKAIYFNPDEPLLRLTGDGWSSLKDKPYLFRKEKSYIYTKIVLPKKLSFSKPEIKKAMFDGSNFKIYPLFSSPDHTAEVNKFGAITVKFSSTDKQIISDFVQIFENGSIVSISNSFLYYSQNKIPLVTLKSGIEKNIKECVSVIKNLTGNDDLNIEVEIGLVNGSECTIFLPKPTGNRYYPDPERGPLEAEDYILSRKMKINDTTKIDQIVREFLLSLLSDIGIEFNYEDHQW